MTAGIIPFTGGSIPDLETLMATSTPRADFGVFLDANGGATDEYGTKVSVQVAIADGDGWNWVDITAYVRSLTWDRGAQDPLTQPAVGTCDIVVDNRLSYFSPWNTTEGYFAGDSYSLILANAPMRVWMNRWDPADHSTIIDIPQFSGRIESVEEGLLNNADAFVTYHLVDVMASLAQHTQGNLMGNGTGAAYVWTAGTAVVLPLTITAGTNDEFQVDGTVYTIGAGTYSDMQSLADAINSATGGGPGPSPLNSEPGGVLCAPFSLSYGLVFTAMDSVLSGSTSFTFGAGTHDALTDLGLTAGQAATSDEDVYWGYTGALMAPAVLTDVGFGFGYDDFVTSIDPLDPFFTVYPLQSPTRSDNRLKALQDVADACNCFVIGTSSGRVGIQRFGPSVDGSPNFGTFSNRPTGDDLPLVQVTPYSSTDRILNKAQGQQRVSTGAAFLIENT